MDGRCLLAAYQDGFQGDHLVALPGDGVEGLGQAGGGQVEAQHLLLDAGIGPDEAERAGGGQGDDKGERPGSEHVDTPEDVGVVRS
ncbi:hypothetical protein D9M71_689790 [compost metagenome]